MQLREYPFNRVSRCVVEEVPGRGYRELPQSSVYGLCSLLNTIFYEKALFVKVDLATALWWKQLLCALRAMLLFRWFVDVGRRTNSDSGEPDLWSNGSLFMGLKEL